MRWRAVVMVVGLTLLACSAHAAQHDRIRPIQVAPGVYAVITPSRDLPNPENRGWNSNSAFVVTSTGVLIFDSGSSTSIGESLKRAVAGVTPLPVRWIVNSHAHGDHWLGNAAFGDTVERVFASAKVAETIRVDGRMWVDRFNRMTEGATGESAILPPDTLIDERTELTLGGTKIVLFPSGDSHSPGDLLMWLPEHEVLVSGDVVYSDRMPSTNASNLRRWTQMLAEIEALKPAVVVPGHGEVTDLSGIVRLRELLTAFWQAVETGYRQGKSDFEMLSAVSEALAPFRPYYPGLDEKLRRDISHVYMQVEAESFN